MQKIDIYELYQSVTQITEKAHAGYLSDTEFTRILQDSEMELFNFLRERFELTDPAHLQPFITTKILKVNGIGMVKFPADYAHKGSVDSAFVKNPKNCSDKIESGQHNCYYLKTNEVSSMLSDSIAKASLITGLYYHTYRNNGIQVFPKELKWVSMTYLRYPKKPSLVFSKETVNGEVDYTYDENASSALEWNRISVNWFKYLILKAVGVELKDQWFVNYSNMMMHNQQKK